MSGSKRDEKADMIATIALLLQLHCDEDRLGEMLHFLSGKPIPEDVDEIIAQLRWAIREVEGRSL